MIKSSVILVAVSLITCRLSAQERQIDLLSRKINDYQKPVVSERLYLQTDKEFYLTGEVCWFKIYSFDGAFFYPLSFSQVAYVELLDKQQHAVLQTKVLLANGHASGSFFVPLSLESDHYSLRTYTRYMQNFDSSFFYSRKLTIVNPSLAPSGGKDQQVITSAQFLPEGGDLVSGLSSTVAFKVFSSAGKAVSCTGQVFDQVGHPVVSFTTLKFGMGSFTFTPKKGNTYYALISSPQHSPKQYRIPNASEEGYVMQVHDSLNTVKLKLQASRAFAQSRVSVLLMSKNKVKSAWELNLQDGLASLIIDRSSIAEGVSSLSIFNSSNEPVCERLIFKIPGSKLVLVTDSLKKVYGTRDLVSFKVRSAGTGNFTKPADLSISVSLQDSLSTGSRSLYTFVNLESILTGEVEEPGFYFNKSNPEWSQAIDNLLLVQGWRRFKSHDQVPHPGFLKFTPELKGHIITGRVTDRLTDHPVSGITAYLSMPGTRLQFYVAKSDSSGILKFFTSDFYGPAEIIAQLDNSRDSNYRVEISNPFSDYKDNLELTGLQLNYHLKYALLARSISMQVGNVFHSTALRQYERPQIDSSYFYGTADQRFKLDEYTRFTTMEEVFREYVRSTQLSIRQRHFQLRVLHSAANEFFQSLPLMLYDGIPIFNSDQLIKLDPLKVKSVDVVSKQFYYGPLSCEGIVSLTSFTGNFPTLQLDPKSLVVDYEGLQVAREFYSPTYETQPQRSRRIPDFRSTLYWSPFLQTGNSGSWDVRFYSSDLTGTYTVTIEGVGPGYRVASEVFTFEVRK